MSPPRAADPSHAPGHPTPDPLPPPGPEVVDLGRMGYEEAYRCQCQRVEALLQARQAAGAPGPDGLPPGPAGHHPAPAEPDRSGTIFFVEHDPVITVTRRPTAMANLLASPEALRRHGVRVVPTDRGGDITYHGPGQLVAYPLLDLRRLGIGVKALVERIEQAVIDTCAAAGIATVRREGAPGVYTADGAKIAALGLRVRRGCSFHGLAFNVDMDLEPFQRINPCGYAGQPVTMLAAHGGPAGLRTVAELLVPRLSSHLGLRPAWQDGAIPGL